MSRKDALTIAMYSWSSGAFAILGVMAGSEIFEVRFGCWVFSVIFGLIAVSGLIVAGTEPPK